MFTAPFNITALFKSVGIRTQITLETVLLFKTINSKWTFFVAMELIIAGLNNCYQSIISLGILEKLCQIS